MQEQNNQKGPLRVPSSTGDGAEMGQETQGMATQGSGRVVRAFEDPHREDRPGAARAVRLRPAADRASQQEEMSAMGKLAGGIAHIFNNLLTAIAMETELALARLPKDDPARKHLREIEKSGERGAALARQLLAFSGRQVLQPRPLQLNDLLLELLDPLRRLLGDGVEVQTVLAPDLVRVQADPAQVEQALLNLAANARDAMPDGGRLTLETTNIPAAPGTPAGANPAAAGGRAASGPPRVLLKVSDTGPGIPEDLRRHVFEPFFTTKAGSEGSGLGLSTVYGIVTQSGGEVELESQPGAGSSFLLYLPCVEEEAGAAMRTGAAEWETILLVEDEDNVRKPLAEILAGRGYTVLEAGSGAEALAASQRHAGPIHLMITDLLMGEMSGVELAERLSFQRPEMKVLYATGYPAGLAESGALGEEAPLLKKPFSGRALAAKIREVLDGGV